MFEKVSIIKISQLMNDSRFIIFVRGSSPNIQKDADELFDMTTNEILMLFLTTSENLFIHTPYFSRKLEPNEKPLQLFPNLILYTKYRAHYRPDFYLEFIPKSRTEDFCVIIKLFMNQQQHILSTYQQTPQGQPNQLPDFPFYIHRNEFRKLYDFAQKLVSVFPYKTAFLAFYFEDKQLNNDTDIQLVFSKLSQSQLKIKLKLESHESNHNYNSYNGSSNSNNSPSNSKNNQNNFSLNRNESNDKNIYDERARLIKDFITDEFNFITKMSHIDIFWEPQLVSNNLVSKSDMAYISGCYRSLIFAHTAFHQELKNKGSFFSSEIINLLCDAHFFFDQTSSFFCNFPAIEAFFKLKSQSPVFQQGISIIISKPECPTKETLLEILLMPIAQLGTLFSFFMKLCQLTPSYHPDFIYINDCKETLAQIIFRFRNLLENPPEQLQAVFALQQKIVSKVEVVSPSRLLIKEFTVKIIRPRSREGKFYIFNDLILLTSCAKKFEKVKFMVDINEYRFTYTNLTVNFHKKAKRKIAFNFLNQEDFDTAMSFIDNSKMKKYNDLGMTETLIYFRSINQNIAMPELCAHECALVGDFLYLIGGHDNQKYASNATVWSTSKNTIKSIRLMSNGIRKFHSVAAVGHNIYVFGGADQDSRILHNFICIDIDNNFSILKMKTLHTPSARYGHTLVTSKKKLFLFGGFDEKNNILSEPYLFVPHSMSWHPITASNCPSPRAFHSCVFLGNRFIIFGGQSNNNILNDIYIYSLVKNEWSSPKITGDPLSPRHGHRAVAYKNWMIIIGGMNEDNQKLPPCGIQFFGNTAYVHNFNLGGNDRPTLENFACTIQNDEIIISGGFIRELKCVSCSIFKAKLPKIILESHDINELVKDNSQPNLGKRANSMFISDIKLDNDETLMNPNIEVEVNQPTVNQLGGDMALLGLSFTDFITAHGQSYGEPNPFLTKPTELPMIFNTAGSKDESLKLPIMNIPQTGAINNFSPFSEVNDDDDDDDEYDEDSESFATMTQQMSDDDFGDSYNSLIAPASNYLFKLHAPQEETDLMPIKNSSINVKKIPQNIVNQMPPPLSSSIGSTITENNNQASDPMQEFASSSLQPPPLGYTFNATESDLNTPMSLKSFEIPNLEELDLDVPNFSVYSGANNYAKPFLKKTSEFSFGNDSETKKEINNLPKSIQDTIDPNVSGNEMKFMNIPPLLTSGITLEKVPPPLSSSIHKPQGIENHHASFGQSPAAIKELHTEHNIVIDDGNEVPISNSMDEIPPLGSTIMAHLNSSKAKMPLELGSFNNNEKFKKIPSLPSDVFLQNSPRLKCSDGTLSSISNDQEIKNSHYFLSSSTNITTGLTADNNSTHLSKMPSDFSLPSLHTELTTEEHGVEHNFQSESEKSSSKPAKISAPPMLSSNDTIEEPIIHRKNLSFKALNDFKGFPPPLYSENSGNDSKEQLSPNLAKKTSSFALPSYPEEDEIIEQKNPPPCIPKIPEKNTSINHKVVSKAPPLGQYLFSDEAKRNSLRFNKNRGIGFNNEIGIPPFPSMMSSSLPSTSFMLSNTNKAVNGATLQNIENLPPTINSQYHFDIESETNFPQNLSSISNKIDSNISTETESRNNQNHNNNLVGNNINSFNYYNDSFNEPNASIKPINNETEKLNNGFGVNDLKFSTPTPTKSNPSEYFVPGNCYNDYEPQTPPCLQSVPTVQSKLKSVSNFDGFNIEPTIVSIPPPPSVDGIIDAPIYPNEFPFPPPSLETLPYSNFLPVNHEKSTFLPILNHESNQPESCSHDLLPPPSIHVESPMTAATPPKYQS
ncbi:hypothetical protein TRFO_40822 [Tritrichomonas foetus]|uniref:DH domain-containing protein n=1 Tax=Tritrichomonas foetus TaxID=1144522 RepID=A0A1J4J089_9EUKA|nr:hypothetical protein TRFO_40822 [Tritrichomonas foetus]|eukprot:OHS92842.1 hypothetical protein TRFO_40822 [Tritrichomonas foetus]